MRFANPAGLWLLLLAAPIVVLHILRPKRPPVEVSSTYLWRDLATPVSAAAPWQRLRWSALLLLQLLAVALLAAAVARPVRVTDAPLALHTVFVVDTSGSMAAVDGDPDRLADAKREALSLREQVPAGGVASIVVASSQPRVALTASPDPRAFADALGPLETTAATADFAGAFTLAESLETPGTPIGFVLLSDGIMSDAERQQLPPGTRYERIGDRSANRAITRLTVEPRGSGVHARVTVRNTGGGDATQTVRFDVDGRTAASVRVRIPDGRSVEQDVDLPVGDRVEAFLEGEDLLAADNRAVAAVAKRRTLRVLHAGPPNVFLDRLLASIPGLTVERTDASRPAGGFDLAVFDQVPVPADPGAPFLAIAPTSAVAGIAPAGEVERPSLTLVRADDPLLAGLDLSDVAIAKAQKVVVQGDEVLLGAEGAPLLVRGSRGGRPFVYLTFALGDSNLPLQVAYPILADRILTDLAGASLPPPDLRVGDALPIESASVVTVVAPGGARSQVPPGAPAPVADRPGFWRLVEEGRPERVVAVNPHPDESRLEPAPDLPVRPRPRVEGERPPAGEIPVLPYLAVVLGLVLVVELLLSRRSRGVSARQWRAAMVVRGVVAACLLLAALGVAIPRTGRDVSTMFLIDASDSMGAAGRQAAVDWVRDALGEQPDGSRAGVAFFGGDARLELTVQERAELVQPATEIDASRTNLAGALRLAAAVLPSDSRRRVVVLSDGRATEGDADAEAARLRAEGIRVDVHAVEQVGGEDVAVARFEAPGRVAAGDEIVLRATITATSAGVARLVLRRDGDIVDERAVELAVGENVIDLLQRAEGSGLRRYRLEVTASGDAVAENNVGFAAVEVEGPGKVLVAEGTAGAGATLADALRAAGMTVDVLTAAALPTVDVLGTYSATVLVDVDARSLTPEQVGALGAATRDLGRGLVTVGGDRSFGLGGYLSSDLEQLLPVVSEIKDPKKRATVAEVIAIDTSGSMGTCHCNEGANGNAGDGNRFRGGVDKTDISRAAAARTIEALGEHDQVGVLAFNTEQRFVLPLQKVPSPEVVDKALGKLKPAGGTDLRTPLEEAAEALRAADTKLKHIILFTDGFTDEGGLDVLEEQAGKLAAEGITVSVLATGEGASDELERVAQAGRGRFYPGRDLSQIPEIMVQEALVASRSFVNEGEFLPKVTSSAEVVERLTSSPPLLGYIATTAKPTAETLLRIGEDEDPLLASWQIGLGRSTAWTSDSAARWAKHWATWDGYVDFWSGVVKDSFLAGGAGTSTLSAEVDGDVLRVKVESEVPFPDGAKATGRVASPDLAGREVALERVSPTAFVGEVPASAAGTYAVGATVTGAGDEPLAALTALASQSYSAEYRPAPVDEALLLRVSERSGGRGAIEPTDAFDVDGLPVGRARVPIAGWLLLAAALLWPIDVALRRLALRGSGLTAAREGAASAAGWVRDRVPAVPGRERPAGPTRPPTQSPPPSPVAPTTGSRPSSPEPAPTTAPAAAPTPAVPPTTVGRLLEKKREARGDGGPPMTPPG